MEHIDENDFYIGVDLGYYTAVAGYIDHKNDHIVMMDRTGGYGQVCTPAVIRYLEEEDRWLIGEEALIEDSMNSHQSIIYILNNLETSQSVVIKGQKYTAERLISIYINVLVDHVYQINPKATIKGICLTVPDQLYHKNEGVLLEALSNKMGKSIADIYIIPNTEAILTFLTKESLGCSEVCMMIDFGHERFRMYELKKGMGIETKPYLELEKLAGKEIFKNINTCFLELYEQQIYKKELSQKDVKSIEALTKKYYAYIFKAYKEKKPLKITYNFCFPPFQCVLGYKRIQEAIEPFENLFSNILSKISIKNTSVEVVVVGNGMKMAWPMNHLKQKHFLKLREERNGIVKGAALVHINKVKVEQLEPLDLDYGVMIIKNNKEEFKAMAYIGDSYRKEFKVLKVIMERKKEENIDLYSRSLLGEITKVTSINMNPITEEDIYCIELSLVFYDETTPSLNVYYEEL